MDRRRGQSRRARERERDRDAGWMAWVNGYWRADGAWVPGYYRRSRPPPPPLPPRNVARPLLVGG